MISRPPHSTQPGFPFDTVAKAVEFYETSAEKVAAAILGPNAPPPDVLRVMHRNALRTAAHKNYTAAVCTVRAEYLDADKAYLLAHDSRQIARLATAHADWQMEIAKIVALKLHGRQRRAIPRADATVAERKQQDTDFAQQMPTRRCSPPDVFSDSAPALLGSARALRFARRLSPYIRPR